MGRDYKDWFGGLEQMRDLQQPWPLKKPGMFQSWRGAMKVAAIGIVGGAVWAAVASSCSLHRPWNELVQQPGVIMNFKPVIVEPMPNVVPAIDLDANEEISI